MLLAADVLPSDDPDLEAPAAAAVSLNPNLVTASQPDVPAACPAGRVVEGPWQPQAADHQMVQGRPHLHRAGSDRVVQAGHSKERAAGPAPAGQRQEMPLQRVLL
jgi:hypothetical protein